MQRIAIFVALPWECQPVLRQLHQVNRGRLGAFPIWRAAGTEREVCLIRTGIGVERAGDAAEAVIAAGSFDLFLSAGCAGALVAELTPGDLAIATCVIGGPTGERFETDGAARLAAQRAAERAALHLTLAPVLCSPLALRTIDAKRTAAAHCDAVAVEMEGAPIATAARRAGIPFASVRAILDTADTNLGVLATFVDPETGAVKPLVLASHVARHPSTVTTLLAMQRMMHAAQRSLEHFFREFLAVC